MGVAVAVGHGDQDGSVGLAAKGAGRRGEGVPTELVAQRRYQPQSECILLLRGEAGEQGRGDDRRRNGSVDGLVQRPAALARVHHDGFDLVEVGLRAQGPLGQLQQPTSHHRAVPPDRSDLVEVEVELLRLGHDLESLGVGLHEAVLDAVVDHLDEVAGARRADVGVTALGGEGEEDRLAGGHRLLGAARPSGNSPP